MTYVLPDLCDQYPDLIRVAAPIFRNYGGRKSFGGAVATLKCFEDNSGVADYVGEPGQGRVLVVDGGGSHNCALLGDNLALKAKQNNWQGIVIYGCVRDVEILHEIDFGVQAIAANPKKSLKKEGGIRGETLSFANFSVSAGEYIYADENGLIVAAEPLT